MSPAPPSDPVSFLRAFHARHAGAAGVVFGPGDDGRGRNSYQVLLDHLPSLPSGARVLDAGCGDGTLLAALATRRPDLRLLGADMSPEELACARARGLEARWIEGDLRDVSRDLAPLDAVISHMVLMLINDIEPVLARLAALLRPGGHLVAVVGRRAPRPEPQRLLLDALWEAVDREVGPPPPLGDRRWSQDEGLRALFPAPTWAAPVVHDLDLVVPVPVAQLRSFVERAWYGMDRLSEAGWTRLLGALDLERVAPGGIYPHHLAIRCLVCRRS